MPDGGQKVGSSVSERACSDITISIYPVRYTIRPKSDEESAYSYNDPNLNQSFPKLERSKYTLRSLRTGFVYLYDETNGKHYLWKAVDGRFQAIELKKMDLVDEKDFILHSEISDSIWMHKDHKVHILFTDTLLTNKLVRQIESNGKIRACMTTIDGGQNFGPDSFPIKKLSSLVEEFRPQDFCEAFSWSDRDNEPAISNPYSLMNLLRTSHPSGQLGLALYDNIGLVEDQARTISLAQEKLQEHINAPQNQRKNMVSDIVEQIYSSAGSDLERYQKHVDNTARDKFLGDYKDDLDRLTGLLFQRKNDRHTWLKDFTSGSTKPTSLASSFLVYDKSNPISGASYAESFTSCMYGMMSEVKKHKGVVDKEKVLFNEWWQMPAPNNPVLLSLKLDTDAAVLGVGVSLAESFVRNEMFHNISVYSLSAPKKWSGPIITAHFDKVLEDALNMPSPENAKALRKLLTDDFKENVTVVAKHLTHREYISKYLKEIGLKELQVEKVYKSTGALAKSEKVVYEIGGVDISKSGLKASSAMPAVTSLSAILYVINLKNAIENFSQDGYDHGVANLLSALFGLGAGVNQIFAVQKLVVRSATFERTVIGRSSTLKFIASKTAGKIFGFGAAIFDGITNLIKARNAWSVGDNDAGNYYTAGAALLLTGGVAVTLGGAGVALVLNPAGLLVVGVLLLGFGVYCLFKAEKALDTPVEKWLKKSVFRKDRKGIYARNFYANEADEYHGYLEAIYSPQISNVDWFYKFPADMYKTNKVEFSIYQPLKDEEYRFAIGMGKNIPKLDLTIMRSKQVTVRSDDRNFRDVRAEVSEFRKSGNGYKYQVTVTNIPYNVYSITVANAYVPAIIDTREKWLKSLFQIKAGVLGRQSYETLDPDLITQ